MPHSLCTDRLLLRPLSLRDGPALARAIGDFSVVKNTGTWPYPVSPEFALFRIAKARGFDPTEDVVFGVWRGQTLIGLAGVHRRLGDEYTVGYMVGPRWAGNGYVTEATRAVCDHAFRRMQAQIIVGEVYDDNPASMRVLEKCGFRHIGPTEPLWSLARSAAFPGQRFELRRERFVS